MSAKDWVADRWRTTRKKTSTRIASRYSQVENDDTILLYTAKWPAYCSTFSSSLATTRWHCSTLPSDTPPRLRKKHQCPMPSTLPAGMKAHLSTIRSRVWRMTRKAEQVKAKTRVRRRQSPQWEAWLDCWQCFSES